jgi:ribonucleoside-triphosphate reductase
MEANGKCNQSCEVYSRIVGYFRPVQMWNQGKKEEFKHRVAFSEEKAGKQISC